MDDPLLVRGFERLGDLPRDQQRFVEGNRAPGDPLRQVVALDQLHHQRTHAARLFEPVDGRDVRVVQRRQRLRFACEPRQAIWVVRKRVGQHLERHLAIQFGVAGAKHLAHAAFADGGEHVVDAKAGAGGEGHGVIIRAASRGPCGPWRRPGSRAIHRRAPSQTRA